MPAVTRTMKKLIDQQYAKNAERELINHVQEANVRFRDAQNTDHRIIVVTYLLGKINAYFHNVIAKNPEKWQVFVAFNYNTIIQMEKLKTTTTISKVPKFTWHLFSMEADEAKENFIPFIKNFKKDIILKNKEAAKAFNHVDDMELIKNAPHVTVRTKA